VEEQRTNSIRNNTGVGAVAGTPGTLPTNWSAFDSALELAVAVGGIGTENGIAYIDIRFSGTVTAQRNGLVFFETGSVVASAAQSWAESSYIKLQSGSLANIEQINLRTDSYNSASGFLSATTSSAITPTSAALVTQRQSLVFTTPASTAFVQPALRIRTNSSGAIDITLRIGLPQLEQGAFATSVIPTSTTAVTRSADVASITGSAFSSWYSQSEGTVFAELVPRTFANLAGVASADDNSSNNRVALRTTTSSLANLRVGVSGVAQADFTASPTLIAGVLTKIAGGYKTDDFAISANGSTAASDTSGTSPTLANQLTIGTAVGNSAVNAPIRRLTYWPTRLSNVSLQQITQ
jgi:hypothetical protein